MIAEEGNRRRSSRKRRRGGRASIGLLLYDFPPPKPHRTISPALPHQVRTWTPAAKYCGFRVHTNRALSLQTVIALRAL